MSAMAQAERERILERTNEGRMEAKAKGVHFGRNPIVNYEHVMTLHEQGKGATTEDREIKCLQNTRS